MSDDILKEAQEAFTECQEREFHNRETFKADIRFARLEEQWPTDIEERFGNDPRLTINKLAPIIRQVVNDARQNKPAITVRPQDGKADVETAEIMTGLVRNIESSSDADTAYDTAVDNAVSGGFGYFRVNTRYACDDNWDQDIVIERVVNPLSIYGDPYSTAADSSDWDVAFVTDHMTKKAFEKKYKGAAQTDWGPGDMANGWMEGEMIQIAEHWTREKVRRKIVLLSDGATIPLGDLEKRAQEFYEAQIEPVGQPRDVMSYKVTYRIMTGVEVVETVEWPGKYIPIIPVYGDEVVLENKRYFRSLIRSAVDAQRMYNYWASKTTAVVALAPRTPYIGRKGAFDTDPNWDNVNKENIAYLEYDGPDAPQRQPFAGVPTGMMQEMMTASEHIKAVTGIYDASLGARSNETSGVAIRNRQMEGDVATFHFIDNLSRAIRHGGRVLIDLIPKVYTEDRVIRVLGLDGGAQTIPLKPQPAPVMKNGKPVTDDQGQPAMRIYDLGAGKYDLAVEAGPSYTTLREETRAEIVEIIRAVPESATILGPMYLRNSDWPGAQEAADLLEGAQGGEEGQGIPPEVQEQMQEQMQQGMELIQQLQQENQALKADAQGKQADVALKGQEMQLKAQEMQNGAAAAQQDAQIKAAELQLEEQKLEIERFRAQTERMKVAAQAETDRIQAEKPEPEPPSERAAA